MHVVITKRIYKIINKAILYGQPQKNESSLSQCLSYTMWRLWLEGWNKKVEYKQVFVKFEFVIAMLYASQMIN